MLCCVCFTTLQNINWFLYTFFIKESSLFLFLSMQWCDFVMNCKYIYGTWRKWRWRSRDVDCVVSYYKNSFEIEGTKLFIRHFGTDQEREISTFLLADGSVNAGTIIIRPQGSVSRYSYTILVATSTRRLTFWTILTNDTWNSK